MISGGARQCCEARGARRVQRRGGAAGQRWEGRGHEGRGHEGGGAGGSGGAAVS